LFPEVPRERWELAFSEFDCGSQIDVDRSKRRCMIVGWRPAIIGLKVFFVPCAGRLASPIFQRWMTLLIYRWIALPKALWFSNPCTASSFTAPRVMFRWNLMNPSQTAITRRIETARDGARRARRQASRLRGRVFFDARRATAGSTRGIWFGLRMTKARCRIPRKTKCSSITRSSARPVCASRCSRRTLAGGAAEPALRVGEFHQMI
jgi:hypothetical protein